MSSSPSSHVLPQYRVLINSPSTHVFLKHVSLAMYSVSPSMHSTSGPGVDGLLVVEVGSGPSVLVEEPFVLVDGLSVLVDGLSVLVDGPFVLVDGP